MYSAIVLCAGQGKRTGLSYNKMFYEYNGKTIYEMTLSHFISDSQCGQIVVVCRNDERDDFKKLVNDSRIEFVEGGKERQDSVYEGLKVCSCEYVLIHDGARPYINQSLINGLLECLKDHKGCLLMVPCKDTIKVVENGIVKQTLKRETLMQAQTPQAFHTKDILKAYKQGINSHYNATDDASMLEAFSDEKVIAVLGDYENIKITTPEDLK